MTNITTMPQSARIIPLPGAATEPVVQERIRGRLPNSVASLKRVRRERVHAADRAAQYAHGIERARNHVVVLERMLHAGRYELIQAQQTAARMGVFHV